MSILGHNGAWVAAGAGPERVHEARKFPQADHTAALPRAMHFPEPFALSKTITVVPAKAYGNVASLAAVGFICQPSLLLATMHAVCT